MRVVVQRVARASVSVGGQEVSRIGRGILCLAGLCREDNEADLAWMTAKLLGLRLWADEAGTPWKRGLAGGSDDDGEKLEVLLVSQFTLYGQVGKGSKPDLHRAMPPNEARDVYARFVEMVAEAHGAEHVKNGEFGAMMEVELVNDGPVTFTLESPSKPTPAAAPKVAPLQPPQPQPRKEGADPAVLLKRAEKKLAKVEALRQKVDKGELAVPNPEQLAKLSSEEALRAEVEQLRIEVQDQAGAKC
ncbi:D-tyrosyl-tRNATyr deacylase [Hondaea fermentalgiana]|uniref:D-aminoacyl-tRNA deacylase n=1 Tax=Hondaea fermentalgiana TaxID=2315210 RepID=A0A2R5GB15_9STRA|nr:D-tyrosyl-tRNATyr deacylase [Hondaea fermentalgiana]|eukprot:GBG26908.1 D-tyrosyl-tRNATyr deacylase [Hondaea fermentalgiana]